ncbi:MAG: pyridoxal-phosphate dependent enzyme [Solirubrobacterales bacterium]
MSYPLLHERFPALRATLPHLPLDEHRPTPVGPLDGLAEDAGLEAGMLWLKDDGAYGSGGWGGNKVRKLEWLLPDVRRRGRRTILTVGGIGTNWGLAAALYGREQGIDVALALIDQPEDEHVRAQLERLRASGATIHRTRTKARTIAAAPWLLLRHSSGLRPPYFLPAGGSSALGAVGYVEAGLEIAAQVEAGELPEPAHVVTAVGSGGTAAGLALGLRLAGLDTRVTGVVVNDTLRLDPKALEKLAGRSARLLAERGAEAAVPVARDLRIESTSEWLGAGYGHPTEESERARALAAGAGIALDPVYTAKAMAATLALSASGRIAGPVLFLQTDGPRPAGPA